MDKTLSLIIRYIVVRFIFSKSVVCKAKRHLSLKYHIISCAWYLSSFRGRITQILRTNIKYIKRISQWKIHWWCLQTLGASLTPDMRIRFAALLQQMYDTKENNAPASDAVQSYTPVLREAVVFALYDHRLFFRDSEHFSLQCEKIALLTTSLIIFLLDIRCIQLFSIYSGMDN